MIITEAEAATELLRRQRARGSLAEYALSIDIPGAPQLGDREGDQLDDAESVLLDGVEVLGAGKLKNRYEDRPTLYTPIKERLAIHHFLMMETIQRCIETPRGRTMVFGPPGCAKSTYGAVVGPSWAMGKWSNYQVILASYATGIAAKQSRKVRSICKSVDYECLWESNPQLLSDQRAIDDWSLTNGSAMMAAGLLAGITGNRADLLVIDDPVANQEQADSGTIREKTYQEFINTGMTRAKPKMSVLIIQTRWNEEDLAGSILPEFYEGESGMIKCRDGQTWDVLSIPAKAERADDPLGRQIGEYLWPEWFPREHWTTWEDNPRAARAWSALYQQRPAPFSGVHFNLDMFGRYDPRLPRVWG